MIKIVNLTDFQSEIGENSMKSMFYTQDIIYFEPRRDLSQMMSAKKGGGQKLMSPNYQILSPVMQFQTKEYPLKKINNMNHQKNFNWFSSYLPTN